MGKTIMINEDTQKTLDKKIMLLRGYLKNLERYVALSNEEINKNQDKLYAMERIFQLVVDKSADINAVLAFQIGGKVPDSLKSSFYELVPLKIIDYSFAEKIAESVKIRNQMTHNYEKLTDLEVMVGIKKFFSMYEIYAKILVEKFIE